MVRVLKSVAGVLKSVAGIPRHTQMLVKVKVLTTVESGSPVAGTKPEPMEICCYGLKTNDQLYSLTNQSRVRKTGSD